MAEVEVTTHAQAIPAGLNLRPGPEDDGWIAPPPVSLSDGTRVQLYKDGEGLRAALEAIRGAQKRICLEIYIFHRDATGRVFADALIERAKAGVAIYLLYDSLGSAEAKEYFREMRAVGIKLAEFHPMAPWRCRFSWRPWNRDHRKLLIIDDAYGWLGGLNIGDEYAGEWVAGRKASLEHLMRDQSIGIAGASVRPLVRSFAQTWHYVKNGGRVSRALYVHNLTIGPLNKGRRVGKPRSYRKSTQRAMRGDFGILASAPTLASPLRPLLNDVLKHAKKSITVIMAYFAPDDELIINLCEAARRGVRVRLILPARSDIHVMVILARSFYSRLLEAGAEVYERRGAVLHAKGLVVDHRYTMIGSANLDYRSIESNLEISSIIDSPDFAKQVDRLMDHDIRFSRKISPNEWRKRPFFDRFVQWLVSRMRYLL
jgi:cardiolipin synthase